MPRRFTRQLPVACTALVLVLGCEQLTGPRPVVSLTLVPQAPTLIVGQSVQLDPNALDADGEPVLDAEITWHSPAPAVATVDGRGTVVAVGAGSTTITATETKDGSVATATITVAVPPSWIGLSVGWAHACALADGGGTWCWGANTFGQIGDGGTSATRSVARPVQAAPAFVALSAGIHHTCGRTASGALHCWGRNDFGQLGDSSFTMRTSAVASGGARSFARFTQGANRNHTCAVTPNDRVLCWGLNLHGQLGDGSTANSSIPLELPGGPSFREATSGFRHSCALTPAGAAYCWGSNAEGQLGDGTLESRAAPTAVAGGLTFVSIGASFQHSCGLTAAGAAYCWGANTVGQLGNGSNAASPAPVAVSGGHSFAQLLVSPGGGCGLSGTGVAHCWGQNSDGQLGDGSISDRNAPVAVGGGHRFASIGAGSRSACGLSTAAELLCWGGNVEGQLGDGGTTSRLTPAPISVPLVGSAYEEVWTGTVGSAVVTLRLRVLGGAISGTGTAADPDDPPTSHLRVTGSLSPSGAVTLSLAPQAQVYNGTIVDANVPAYPFTGTRTRPSRIVGTVIGPEGAVALTLTRQ